MNSVTLSEQPVPSLRKVRKDCKYSSNAERQRAYRLRKKALFEYCAQLEAQADADESNSEGDSN
jgi:hypothetical protein